MKKDQHATSELFENKENAFFHTPYCEELALLNCVKEGNVKKLERTYRTLPDIVYGNMATDPLKQLFYGSIANTTLVTRFAIEGGLDEETAFSLSDFYIKKMEKTASLEALQKLNEEMAIEFTQYVHCANKEFSNFSTPIRKCITYLEIHNHENITLEQMAKVINLSPKYLSVLFSQETGISFHTYQTGKKIEEAQTLLKHSSMTYSEIAEVLGFSSQSHFCSVFKKHTGTTPARYRKYN